MKNWWAIILSNLVLEKMFEVTLLIVLLWDTIQEKFLGEVGLLTNCWRLCNADDAITTYYTCCILNSNNW